jgi:hypothetical protein
LILPIRIEAEHRREENQPMDDIIAAIRRRLETKITDIGQSWRPGLIPSEPPDFASDERRLGFAIFQPKLNERRRSAHRLST